MSSARTRVEYEGCKSCVDKINQQITVLTEAANTIDKTMQEISNYWEGTSHDKAQEEYTFNYKKQLTQDVPKAVEEFRTYINKCHEIIKQADIAMSGN
ncbi:MAG: WXG100 family type VII secretion target [Oscillospiraceae bacterium]|nr:WXG100 family type VII secretion target [Oscillospiraceae bacterium]